MDTIIPHPNTEITASAIRAQLKQAGLDSQVTAAPDARYGVWLLLWTDRGGVIQTPWHYESAPETLRANEVMELLGYYRTSDSAANRSYTETGMAALYLPLADRARAVV